MKTPTEITRLAEISGILYGYRLTHAIESDLQDAVEQALQSASEPATREADLGAAGRIDFLTEDGIGIECKVEGSVSDVAQQLIRYAGSPRVRGLVLLTTRARLGAGLPSFIGGKPLAVCATWGSAL